MPKKRDSVKTPYAGQVDDESGEPAKQPTPSKYIYTLQEMRDLELWHVPKPFFKTGFRRESSVAECAQSLCMVHNETCNVWSHLVGALYFTFQLMSIGLGAEPYDQVRGPTHKMLLVIANVCTVVCLGLSTTYHQFQSCSVTHYHTLMWYDFTGVVIMIFGLAVTAVYAAFEPYPTENSSTIGLLLAFMVLQLVLQQIPCY